MPARSLRSKVHFFAFCFIAFLFTGVNVIARPLWETGAPRYGDLGSAADTVPFLEEIRSGSLDNGLKYYLRQNVKPEGRAFLKLVVNAGSILETEEEKGLAHFVEHMAFNGTENFPKSELINYLRSLGMRFGPEINAYTSFNETVYGIEVPTEINTDGKKTVAPKALDVLRDWSSAVSFLPEDVDAERPIIQEEYRAGLGAMDRVQRKILPVLFEGSLYADRLPIGDMSIVKNAPAERLASFYKNWYRPDNMALVFVGDFDLDLMEAALREHFHTDGSREPTNRPSYELPPPSPGRFSLTTATDPELTYGFVHLYFKRPPEGIGQNLSSYRAGLLEALIDQILSARFQEAAVKPETAFAAAASGMERYGVESRFFVLSAIPEPGAVEATLEALFSEVESIRRYGFSRSELERAVASLLSYLDAVASEGDKTESSVLADELVRHYLTGETIPGIAWEAKAARALLADLTLEELSSAAAAFFTADDLSVFLLAPEADSASLPSEAQVASIRAAVATADIQAPEDERLEGALIQALPRAIAIASEKKAPVSGELIWELFNGATIIYKQTNNQNNQLLLQASAKGGTTWADDVDAMSAIFASALLSVSGVGPYSTPELSKRLAGKQASLSFDISDYQRSLSGGAITKDLKTLFELIYLTFSAPRIDDAATAAALDQVKTALLQRQENPDAIFSDAVTSIVSGNHPRFAPLKVEKLAEVNTARARSLLSEALRIGDFTFVFVGSVDPAELRPLVEQYIASLPGNARSASWKDLGIKRPSSMETTLFKGAAEKAYVFLGWFADRPYSESFAVSSGVLEQYIDIRLTDEIREKLGGVYSANVSISQAAVPKGEVAASIVFVCDPGRAEELTASVIAELEAIANGLIDKETFAKAVESIKKAYEVGIQNDQYLASSLLSYAVNLDLPLATLYERPTLYNAITPVELTNTAALLLEKGTVRVTLLPESAE